MNADSSGGMGSKLGATPNLDAFAATAFRFEQCHVTVPICQPSRSALMTGRVPHRNGALGFNPIRTDVPTLVEMLKGAGYYAAVINKSMHMKPDAKFPWDLAQERLGQEPGRPGRRLREGPPGGQGGGAAVLHQRQHHRPAPAVPRRRRRREATRGEGRATKKAAAKKAATKKAKKLEAANAHLGRVYRPEEVVVPSFLEDIPLVRKEVAQYFTGVARFDVSFGKILDGARRPRGTPTTP